MKLNIKQSILEDVINVKISVETLGNGTLDEDTEREYLNDYVTTFQYSDITFAENMKLSVDGLPIATQDEVEDGVVANIELKNIINKVYRLDENMVIDFSINTTKIPDSELVAPFSTKPLYGQALATVFIDKIQATIADKLTTLRSMENTFEGEKEIIL